MQPRRGRPSTHEKQAATTLPLRLGNSFLAALPAPAPGPCLGRPRLVSWSPSHLLDDLSAAACSSAKLEVAETTLHVGQDSARRSYITSVAEPSARDYLLFYDPETRAFVIEMMPPSYTVTSETEPQNPSDEKRGDDGSADIHAALGLSSSEEDPIDGEGNGHFFDGAGHIAATSDMESIALTGVNQASHQHHAAHGKSASTEFASSSQQVARRPISLSARAALSSSDDSSASDDDVDDD